MSAVSPEVLQQLFEQARTPRQWTHHEVETALLLQLYDLVKMGPTSANCQPARFAFLTQTVSKEKLRPALSAGNVDMAMSAPVIVIIAQDPLFYEELPQLFPEVELRSWYAEDIPFAEETATRNSTLQGAYMIMAARALGLDALPMSGFDNHMVDNLFFEKEGWNSNFILCLGYADQEGMTERLPRLAFEDACLML